MAKYQIKANAHIDLLTKEEVADILSGWRIELARGVKYRNFSGKDTTGGATYTIGLDGADPLGPNAGFVWSVMRLYVSGPGVIAGTDLFSVYLNEVAPSRLVRSGLTRGAEWGEAGFVLNPNDKIVIAGAATGTANADIVVAGQAIELPIQLAYQLA